jgi:hypothetical protein
MKTIVPVLLVSLAVGCATKPRPVLALRPFTPSSSPADASLRHSEWVHTYHVGRLIDPLHPEVMHEAGAFHRVEQPARWNLHPGLAPSAGSMTTPPSPGSAANRWPGDDALVAEINRQKEITAAVLAQANRLNLTLEQLGTAMTAMQATVRSQAELADRLRRLEEKLQSTGSSTSPDQPASDTP